MGRTPAMASLKVTPYLVIILAAASVLTIISTVFTYRNAMRAAEDSLKLQALGIAVSLEATVTRLSPGDATIFKEIITQGLWEGIAFIALYDKDGTTLLHSNENLIGRKTEDPAIKSAAESGEPLYGFVTLGTGEEVFVITYPVHGGRAQRFLRVALHTFPVEGIIRQARFEAFSTLAVLAVLWVLGLFFIKAVRRSEALSRAMAERERFALLGEMASVLAHEIRNPLGSIKGFAQYLLEDPSTVSGHPPPAVGTGSPDPSGPQSSDSTSQKAREYLGIIVSESRRLEKLTEDLLSYARPVELRPRDFDLTGLVRDIVQSFSRTDPRTRDVRLTLALPESLKIETDPDKVNQIVANLLQNALDAAPPGGSVLVVAGERQGEVALSVQDNGAGMDAETLAKSREPFFTTKTQGTGLGLAIVARLAEALSGAVDIDSTPGKGTTVTLTLPGRITRSS